MAQGNLRASATKMLRGSALGGFFLSLMTLLVGFGYRANAEFATGGTPEQREAEIEGLDEDVRRIDGLGRQLRLVTSARETLGNLYMLSEDLRLDMKAPPFTISYDKAWLIQMQDKLSKEIAAATLQTELKVIHSPYISNDDFVKFAKVLSKNSGPLGDAQIMLAFRNNDFEFEPIPAMRACQQAAAAKYGATPSQESADAIARCTRDNPDWYSRKLYGACAGIFALGLYGRRLRKKWERAAAPVAVAAAPPPDPDTTAPAANGIETTRDIQVRSLKLLRKTSGVC
ncbi:MAG: hypothetical protein ACAH83_20000 [Alphaproteobacteria bacterium]